jgi:hypothetical protein
MPISLGQKKKKSSEIIDQTKSQKVSKQNYVCNG